MSANISSAVMQQRSEPHDSLDDFPTPPWATRALCEYLRQHSPIADLTCREPCANRGYMVRPLTEAFSAVEASDIFDYGAGFGLADYLFGPQPSQVNWTVLNPPFRLATQFIERALQTSSCGVAVLVRSAFLEGEQRYKSLFRHVPPTRVLQFCERVVMAKGILRDPAKLYWNETKQRWQKPSSATAYSWLVWRHGVQPEPFGWIAPCRRRLERLGDYPAFAGSAP